MEPALQAQLVLAAYAAGKLIVVACVAWGLGQLVRTQVKELRLERASSSGTRAFQWSALFGTLTFWAILLLGTAWVARGSALEGSADLLEALFQLVAAGIAATVALLVTTKIRGTDTSTYRASRIRLSVFFGVTAITAVFLGASTALVWLVLIASFAVVAVTLSKPPGRARVAQLIADFAAGVRLIDLDIIGRELSDGTRALRVIERGLFQSKLQAPGDVVTMHNETLHALIQNQFKRPESVDDEPGQAARPDL